MADRCKSCNAAIKWIVTPKGRRMPVDIDPVIAGDQPMKLVSDTGNVFTARAGEKGYISHFATCPDANKFRKHNDNDKRQSAQQ